MDPISVRKWGWGYIDYILEARMATSTFLLLLVSATATCCLASSYDLNACTYTGVNGKVYDLSPLIPKK